MINIPPIVKNVVNRSFWVYALIILIFGISVDFKKAAKQRTRYLLGVFYNQELNNYTDGIVYFDYLSRLRPNDGRNYFFLGYCYLFLQQYDKALVYFEKASLLMPQDDLTRQYLAHVKSKIENKGPEIPVPAGTIAIPLE